MIDRSDWKAQVREFFDIPKSIILFFHIAGAPLWFLSYIYVHGFQWWTIPVSLLTPNIITIPMSLFWYFILRRDISED